MIVRTAAEGATEEQLTRDVTGCTAQWEDIAKQAETGKRAAAAVRRAGPGDQGRPRPLQRGLRAALVSTATTRGTRSRATSATSPRTCVRARWEKCDRATGDVFAAYRIDEQIHKALDRKVYLPSGGSLVIDRTEAMTVVDVNTGKFTGTGGNLEETVTKNNLEAAEEIVRQLRLRDIGGIIVIDFIDMVLESNRDLVLRRLVECLGRDRTRHQVAEVTSLGLGPDDPQAHRHRACSSRSATSARPASGRGVDRCTAAPVEAKKEESRQPACPQPSRRPRPWREGRRVPSPGSRSEPGEAG